MGVNVDARKFDIIGSMAVPMKAPTLLMSKGTSMYAPSNSVQNAESRKMQRRRRREGRKNPKQMHSGSMENAAQAVITQVQSGTAWHWPMMHDFDRNDKYELGLRHVINEIKNNKICFRAETCKHGLRGYGCEKTYLQISLNVYSNI